MTCRGQKGAAPAHDPHWCIKPGDNRLISVYPRSIRNHSGHSQCHILASLKCIREQGRCSPGLDLCLSLKGLDSLLKHHLAPKQIHFISDQISIADDGSVLAVRAHSSNPRPKLPLIPPLLMQNHYVRPSLRTIASWRRAGEVLGGEETTVLADAQPCSYKLDGVGWEQEALKER